VVDKAGRARWVLLTKLPLRDSAGNITGLIGVSRDVTERRRTEDELRRLYEAERQRRRLAEALREAGNTLSATLDLDEVLDHLLVQIQTIVPSDASAVLLVESGRARVARSRGYERYGAEVAGAIAARAIEVAVVPCLQEMARSGQPMVVSDTALAEQCVRELHSPSVGSCLGAPVMSQGEMIAFFTLEKEEHGFYQPEHAAYLAPFTAQAALALQNARLYQETVAALERERTYNEIARAATSTLDLPDILQNMTRLAARLVGADCAALSLVTPDGQVMHTPYIYNLPRLLVQRNLKRGEGVAWHVVETGESALLGEYDAHPQARSGWAEAGVHGFIGVPIAAGEARLGALGLFSLAPHKPFTARDVAVAAAVGQQAGSAIQRAQLFDEVRQLAVTDSLTGLFNRRYFFTLAEQEFAHARAEGRRLGILMVDIDYFKHVNDTYGHVAGDHVLEYVVGCCRAGVGEAGVLARYGGEEFVALFRGMGQPEVDAIAQAVCARIRQTTVAAGGHAIAVTASVGSAELDDTCAAMEDLLVHADRALYVAKRAGGDRAVAWQGEPAGEF
jgi:diguanylate cyclase (GGDEF)-like protein